MLISKTDLLISKPLAALYFLEIYILGLGMSLILATAFVKFRDVSYIWEVILKLAFMQHPIIYPLTRIPNETFQKVILLNPMAQAIQDARYSLVTHRSHLPSTQVFNSQLHDD